MLLRLKDRLHLTLTGFFVVALGLLLWLAPEGKAVSVSAATYTQIPMNWWGTIFIALGVACLISAARSSFSTGRWCLVVAAGIMFGFSTVYWAQAFAGDYTFLFPAVTWVYLSAQNIMLQTQIDPHLLKKIQREVKKARGMREALRDSAS